MEQCPKCHERSLVFDPYTRVATCLRLECSYREAMNRVEYYERFQSVTRNTQRQLSMRFDKLGSVASEGTT